MRKFKRIYFFVPFITAMLLFAVKKDLAAFPVNYWLYENNLADTIVPGDTTLLLADSLLAADTTTPPSTDTFTLRISKDTLEAPVKYYAEDSAVLLIPEKQIVLYGKATTEYQDMSLKAPVIELGQGQNIIRAKAARDSVGEIKDYAEMKQGENEFKSEGMEYNFKTMQGLTRGTITQQGEMFIHADIVKKVDEQTMYGKGAFFTTCNLDIPHFGFRANKIKVVNKKLAITGPVRPEFDSVPVPVYIPFGIYPLYQGRHSGMLAPSLETNNEMGLGLSRLGYYHVVNDYWDVQVNGNIYSSGTYQINVIPTYRKIYKYSGSFTLGYNSYRFNTRGDPDFRKTKTYNISWNHASDMRSRPGTSFSANVNASSTKNNELMPNSNLLNFSNTMSSSITYAKTWEDKPYSLTVSANHNQANVSRTVDLNLPDVGFSVTTIYPFQKRESAGTKKWYEQLGIGYQGSFRNGVTFIDTVNAKEVYGKPLFAHLLDTMRWGANHSIPISLTLPPILGGAIMVSPSISYSQEWIDRISKWEYDEKNDTLLVHSQKTFKIKQQASLGLGFSTSLYGTYQFKNSRVVALRHVVRPNFGFSYSPDLNRKYIKTVRVKKDTTAIVDELAGLYSRPVDFFNSREFGGVTFGLDNNLEMKVRVKQKNKDTTETTSSDDENSGFKKIRLIDGFGFNSSYNIFADSMKLSPLNFYLRSNLFDKININFSATLNPYQDSMGRPTPRYAWQANGGKFSLGSITNASISASTSFQSKPKDAEKEKRRQENINRNLNDPMLQNDQQRLLEYMRQNPAEFVDFNTPWSVSLSYSLNYYKGFNTIYRRYENRITSSTNVSGSFNLTPKWNFSVNGFYDFTTNQIQTVGLAISRDLHCWQMSINVSPIGRYRYFNFTINPKAGILQDLKINRNRSFSSGVGY